jgi:hypothetical protein
VKLASDDGSNCVCTHPPSNSPARTSAIPRPAIPAPLHAVWRAPAIGSSNPSTPHLATQKDSTLPEPRQTQFDGLLSLLQESRSLDPRCGKLRLPRSGMGLAEPHLAAYAQYVNLGFTIRSLYQSACPQTRYDPRGGNWDAATTCRNSPDRPSAYGFAPV